jgi:hypothetical protein
MADGFIPAATDGDTEMDLGNPRILAHRPRQPEQPRQQPRKQPSKKSSKKAGKKSVKKYRKRPRQLSHDGIPLIKRESTR